MKKKPLISCVMVSSDRNRWHFCQRAINMFMEQTYEKKELIFVSNGVDEYNSMIADFVKSNKAIKHIMVSRQGEQQLKTILGALRNISIENAEGEFILQWDDDDLYHPNRMQEQWQSIVRDEADFCLLKDFMLKIKDKDAVPIRYPRINKILQGNPSTILFRRTIQRYAEVDKGEDDQFVRDLIEKGMRWSLLEGMPHLYTYCYQGSNTMGYHHFLAMKKLHSKLH